MQAVTGDKGKQREDGLLALYKDVLEQYDSGDIKGGLSHYALGADILGSGVRGLDQFEAFLSRIYTAFPDGHHEIADSFESGDVLGVELAFVGTHTGGLIASTGQEILPTGKKVRVAIGSIVRFRDGWIVYHHSYWDRLEVFQQLGVMK